MGKTVYIVTHAYYDDWAVLDVFSSLEEAQKYVDKEQDRYKDEYYYVIYERILRD